MHYSKIYLACLQNLQCQFLLAFRLYIGQIIWPQHRAVFHSKMSFEVVRPCQHDWTQRAFVLFRVMRLHMLLYIAHVFPAHVTGHRRCMGLVVMQRYFERLYYALNVWNIVAELFLGVIVFVGISFTCNIYATD